MKSVATFYVENFGCRATQADGAAIERQFAECGLSRAPGPSAAEIVVLNTCTVTAAADQDARAAIRRIHRTNPACQIVVTGCYAQRAPEEIAALPAVSQVIGNSHKHRLAEIALTSAAKAGLVNESRIAALKRCATQNQSSSLSPNNSTFVSLSMLASDNDEQRRTTNDERPIFVSDIFAHTELLAAPVFEAANERTRPNLKVQDGCDNRCSFCVIPSVRGHSRSLPLEEVLREVNALVEGGYKEVVISGINLGRWGRDLPVVSPQPSGFSMAIESSPPLFRPYGAGSLPTSTQGLRPGLHSSAASRLSPKLGQTFRFEDLVGAILDETALEKLRISSVEPMDWSDELIALMAGSPRIAKHAHVPLQSGSDAVLRRMHRKYRPWHYREKIAKIRGAMPSAAIGADVMVGFPGETESEFAETWRMVEDLPFTYLHVFTYSARPGTAAAAMPNQIPVRVARERNRILRELAAEKKLAFMQSFIGQLVEAITLNRFDGEGTEALTDNYLKLRLKGHHDANRWLSARVGKVEAGELVGTA